MADNAAAIAKIEQILRAGARRVTVDGIVTEFDFDQLRRELRRLKATDDSQRGKRPVVSTINLSNS